MDEGVPERRAPERRAGRSRAGRSRVATRRARRRRLLAEPCLRAELRHARIRPARANLPVRDRAGRSVSRVLRVPGVPRVPAAVAKGHAPVPPHARHHLGASRFVRRSRVNRLANRRGRAGHPELVDRVVACASGH